MSTLVEILGSPWPYAIFLLGFGFLPPLMIRIFVLIYPKGHERRRELPAEMAAVPYQERPLWLAEQLSLALTEGLWERLRWLPVVVVLVDWYTVAVRTVIALGSVGVGFALLSKFGIWAALVLFGAGLVLIVAVLANVWRGLRLGGRRDQLVALLLTAMGPGD